MKWAGVFCFACFDSLCLLWLAVSSTASQRPLEKTQSALFDEILPAPELVCSRLLARLEKELSPLAVDTLFLRRPKWKEPAGSYLRSRHCRLYQRYRVSVFPFCRPVLAALSCHAKITVEYISLYRPWRWWEIHLCQIEHHTDSQMRETPQQIGVQDKPCVNFTP